MPPREPRGLYLKREYFSDFEFQTTLNAAEREAYMGLWQLADDAGWLDWEPAQVAAHLYRFEGRSGLALLESVTGALVSTGRLRILRCGHAQLPRGEGHARPGRPSNNQESFENHRKHSGKQSKVSIPHHTVPHLTSPSRVGSPGAVARKGAPARGNGVQSIGDLMPDLKPEIKGVAGAKKS